MIRIKYVIYLKNRCGIIHENVFIPHGNSLVECIRQSVQHYDCQQFETPEKIEACQKSTTTML